MTLDEFRATVLLDSAFLKDGPVPLILPSVYNDVRAQWRCYQAHAYATYALEALLGVVLARATTLSGDREGVPYQPLLDNVVATIEQADQTRFDPALHNWLHRPVGDLMAALKSHVLSGSTAPHQEPFLCSNIVSMASGGVAKDHAVWTHDASLLLLLSVARLQHLARITPEAWIGDRDAQRLPPSQLIEHTRRAVAEGCSTAEYIRRVLHEHVVRQHQRNALRKLAADPRKLTAKLSIEQGRLIPLQHHEPGTSNPRFNNAVVFMQDLGYLAREEPITTTPDGDALVEQIRLRSPS